MNVNSFLTYIILLPFVLKLAIAQACWRNTTCNGPGDTAFPGKWDANIYAPSSRTVSPKSIVSQTPGDVSSSYSSPNYLSGNGSQVVFDFGMEVGGWVTITYAANGTGTLGLAFTEAKNWIGEFADSSNGKFTLGDGALFSPFNSGSGSYVMPDSSLRGGFRYMTVFLVTNSSASISIDDISLEVGFQPTWSNLRAYQGYFHSSDETLNKIWYSGAYTLQTNAVPVNTGRWVPMLNHGWANNGTLGPGETIIVDGAKRDRAVWPGDMGIAVPSTFDNTTGAFPEAGPPLLQLGSDTYHMWTMIGTYNYVLYTNDISFLLQNWPKYLKAMDFIYDKLDNVGLLNVTGIRDWARWQQGYNNSEANMMTLLTGADLATWAGDTNLTTLWTSRASSLRSKINMYCWDTNYGAFKDNATDTTLHPQDANSMSILFGVVDSPARASNVSTKLLENWTPIGAVAPELPDNISPFISSFEIQAHFTLGETARALDLIRRSWGWYLNNANGTESTVIEGYLQNGSFSYRSSRGYDYDASYVSHSHGWSSGPTSALTEYVIGLSITSPVGQTWKLAPQFGDLTSAEGGFVTSLGKFQAGWKFKAKGYTLEYRIPTSELLAERLQAWKHAVGYLEDYIVAVEKTEKAKAKEFERVLKGIITSHTETEKNIKGSVLPILERLHKEIKNKSKELSSGAAKGAKEVEKARNTTQKHIELLGQHTASFESAGGNMKSSDDPYVIHRGVFHRLNKQILEENNNRHDLLAVQTNFAQFEGHVIEVIQQTLMAFNQFVGSQAQKEQTFWSDMLTSAQAVPPDFEWQRFVQRSGALLMNPTDGERSVEGITFPNQNHRSTQPLIEGSLERKSRNKLNFNKYSTGYYVVTPSKFLHEFKDSDNFRKDPVPELSIYLPDATIGATSGEKFNVKGKDVSKGIGSKLSGSPELSFKAHSAADAQKWFDVIRSAAGAGPTDPYTSAPTSPVGSSNPPVYEGHKAEEGRGQPAHIQTQGIIGTGGETVSSPVAAMPVSAIDHAVGNDKI
ncbi:hypothetical protein B7494_g2346 [Chlorociboria aeruginascens]|nr:hypothetical protein B7494_g2346 [Chlorociboria aeruginascens]